MARKVHTARGAGGGLLRDAQGGATRFGAAPTRLSCCCLCTAAADAYAPSCRCLSGGSQRAAGSACGQGGGCGHGHSEAGGGPSTASCVPPLPPPFFLPMRLHLQAPALRDPPTHVACPAPSAVHRAAERSRCYAHCLSGVDILREARAAPTSQGSPQHRGPRRAT